MKLFSLLQKAWDGQRRYLCIASLHYLYAQTYITNVTVADIA
ncbi:hypothetical protein [Flavobacterium silvaticum]|nr:hypothetical protein [Flavobacterium silvaticum]